MLQSAITEMSWLYKLLGNPHILQDEHRLLVSALVKSGTIKGMQKSKVMPIGPFNLLFNEWHENCDIGI